MDTLLVTRVVAEMGDGGVVKHHICTYSHQRRQMV